VPPRTAKPQIK